MPLPIIHHVHIADGFADDCEDLIHRWLKSNSYTYETFCEIWKDMQFGYMYHGRTSGAEIAELTEELLHIAKRYMVSNTSNFEESVAGLFLVYGILNLQPYAGFAPLRVVPEDVPPLNRIEMISRREKRYDVLYILGSVLIEGPVHYQVDARERGMESSIRKYLEGYTTIDRQGVRPKGVFYRQNEELDLIREINCISRRYVDAKTSVQGESNRDLNYLNENFATELDTSLKKIINGIIEDSDEESMDTPGGSDTNAVHAVKDKAMKLSVVNVRYLQSAATKNIPTEKRNSKTKCEIKQKPGKVKQGSPKKPVPSPIKHATEPKKRTNKRKRKTSSACKDLNLSNRKPAADLDVASFDKAISGTLEITSEDLDLILQPENYTTAEEGKIEIEFIDEMAEEPKPETSEVKTPVKNHRPAKKAKIKVKDVRKLIPGPKGARLISTPLEQKILFQNPEKKLKKLQKRDLKKPQVRSKFKRMGILEVANFKEPDNPPKN